MNVYCINPIGSGNGFKVHVADQGDGLRVVGIFRTETEAEAWIEADRGLKRLARGKNACGRAAQA